jgi:putative glycosyl hydrolase-like family 15 (GHL15) protein
MRSDRRGLALVLLLASHAVFARGAGAAGVRFVAVADSSFDQFTATPTADQKLWMQAHYTRMLTYSPYFDARLAWFPAAWVYKDLYAVYVGSADAARHPEWILRDLAGNALYIPYACAAGRCPQYAADVGNPDFRAAWIADAATTLAAGYRGLFVDDVNLTLARVSDGTGEAVVPLDPRTGRGMTEDAWRGYMADFTADIRAAFPSVEIVHNALWFLGDRDPSMQREIAAADFVALERGVNDAGIVGGTGTYGFDTFLAHVDAIHDMGRAVVFLPGARSRAQREYGLAALFLLDGDDDMLGNAPGGMPDRWWPGYDVVLGSPRGVRYGWAGVLRRDFDGGLVLLNPPDAPTARVALGRTCSDLRGRRRRTVTLRSASGAVLQCAPG